MITKFSCRTSTPNANALERGEFIHEQSRRTGYRAAGHCDKASRHSRAAPPSLQRVAPDGTVSGSRKHDVYGLTRGGTGTLTSKHGFVGSLGHASEDETGLIYMQARYYDPQTGRFASEDKDHDGLNWYCYAVNNPVCAVDATGCDTLWQQIKKDVSWTCMALGLMFALGAVAMMMQYFRHPEAPLSYMKEAPGQLARLGAAANLACLATASFGSAAVGLVSNEVVNYLLAGVGFAQTAIIALCKGAEQGMKSTASIAIAAAFTYGCMVLGATLSVGADG